MATVFLILASLLPTDGPPRIAQDQRAYTLAGHLSSSWFGNWSRAGDKDGGVVLRRGYLTLPMPPRGRRMRLAIDAEGPGWFRGRIGAGELPIVGIWRYQRGMLTMCWQDASKGFPRRFEDGEQREVITLWPR